MKKTKHYLAVLACSLLILLLFISYAHAGLSDFVYAAGRGETSRLAAQNAEAQRVLDIFNSVSGSQEYFASFITSELCKAESEVCGLAQTVRQYGSYASYLENPQGFLESFGAQQFCVQNKEACNKYHEALGQYSRVEGELGRFKDPNLVENMAKAYAMAEASKHLSSTLGARLSTLYRYKHYLDALALEEAPAKKKEEAKAEETKEMWDPLKDVDDDEKLVGWAVAETEESNTEIKPESWQRDKCVIGFNLDGTYGDIIQCKMTIEKDISEFISKPLGTVLVGEECEITRSKSGLTITTEDAEGKLAKCFVKVGRNSYTNLIGGEIDGVRSATFEVNEEGKLINAQFQVASKATEYVFDERKYRLQAGTLVLYDEGDVNFNFDHVKNRRIELFRPREGKWIASGLVTPKGLAPVRVELMPDGVYRFTGKFEVSGLSEFEIGESSDATVEGFNIRTIAERPVRVMSCETLEGGEWISLCKKGKKVSYEAQGNGFAFKEPLENGPWFYMKGGSVALDLEETARGYRRRSKDINKGINGNVMWETGAGYYEQNNKVLDAPVDGATYRIMGLTKEKAGSAVAALGAPGVRSLLLAGEDAPRPDALKDMDYPEDPATESTLILEDAGLVAYSDGESTCVVPMEDVESSLVTAGAVVDITGMQTLEEEQAAKRMQELEERMASFTKEKECPVTINPPTKLPSYDVVLHKPFFGTNYLSVGDRKVETIFLKSENKLLALALEGRKYYYVDPNTGAMYDSAARTNQLATLDSNQLEFAIDGISGEERKALEEKEEQPLVAGRFYVLGNREGREVRTADWIFSRVREGWQCTKPIGNKPCPSYELYNYYFICVEKAAPNRAFFYPMDKAVGFELGTGGCPSDSLRTDIWTAQQGR